MSTSFHSSSSAPPPPPSSIFRSNKPPINHHALDPVEILPDYKPHLLIPQSEASSDASSNRGSPPRKLSGLQVVPDHGAYPHSNHEEHQGYPNESPLSPDVLGKRNLSHAPAQLRTMSLSETDDSSQPEFQDGEPAAEDHHIFERPPPRTGPGHEAQGSYDLKPPPPMTPLFNIEMLTDRLFSLDHLKLIIRDSTFLAHFQLFLQKYKPDLSPTLRSYVETQKALSAVEYANAIAATISKDSVAATIEPKFEENTSDAVDTLVQHALPGYITHRLVRIVTETLVKEITGQNTPIMRELVAGLAEVYCLTDPSLPDNPIVYASEEFYKCTQYGRDYVIGRNCRFLQGPRSNPTSIQRLVDALAEGQETCETILNYRRDGSPFVNLLMIAPLYDNKAQVRYFIGAQIDINGLIEGGRGLDSFERLLQQDAVTRRYGGHHPNNPHNNRSTRAVLAELAAMWSIDEIDIARRTTRQRSTSDSSHGTPKSRTHTQPGRMYLGMDDLAERNMWPAKSLGISGRLPGVFQNYMLVRPFPSLRITFTSPALRIPGLLQSKFLDRIGGSDHVRDGVLSAMSSGIGVTAKVTWLPVTGHMNTTHTPADPLASQSVSGATSSAPSRPGSKHHGGHHHLGPHRAPAGSRGAEELGKTRWIHCTPLLGSDDKVGVWMVVMVESESITGALNAHERAVDANQTAAREITQASAPARGATPNYSKIESSPRLRDDLYARYMRAEGRNSTLNRTLNDTEAKEEPTTLTASIQAKRTRELERERSRELKQERARLLADRAVDEQFKDF